MDAKSVQEELQYFKHSCDLQIRFSDVDVLGHVNNTVYLSFYDTGKAYFFAAILGRRIEWKHVETVIVNVDCCFANPIFFGEEIEVRTRCVHVGEKSFKLQQVVLEKGSGVLKSASETVMVAFDAEHTRAVELPPIWREALTRSMLETQAKPDMTDASQN